VEPRPTDDRIAPASDRGADRAAFIATVIMSAKLNDIDPQAWLANGLANIADTPDPNARLATRRTAPGGLKPVPAS